MNLSRVLPTIERDFKGIGGLYIDFYVLCSQAFQEVYQKLFYHLVER